METELNLLALLVFWISAIWIAYAYLGYPLILLVWSALREKPVAREDFTPLVSVIVAAHNEERVIRRKIENLLSQDYPQELLEIVVVSDHSTDATENIVESFSEERVRLVVIPERAGKHPAQQHGIKNAKADILIFTDAAPVLDAGAIRNIAKNFADPQIGCVGGEDWVIDEGDSGSSEGAYIAYDMWLRRMESAVGSSVGVSGALFGVQRQVCEPWHNERSSDLHLALQAVRRGLRAVHDPSVLHFYTATEQQGAEFTRKVRTIVNGIHVFAHSLDLLNFFKYGFFSVQLFSHKLCRWLVPFALISILLSSGGLSYEPGVYRYGFIAQCSLYTLAIIGLQFPALNQTPVIRIPSFFVLSNAAIAVAWLRFWFGRKTFIWQPTERP